MSLHVIVNLLSQYRGSQNSSEVGWIKWKNTDFEQAFKEGVNVFTTKSLDISYQAYVVCVQVDKQEEDEDLTDAEEEIMMTPMICSKTRSTTIIPDSDDEGGNSDDSGDSIILASQDVKKDFSTSTFPRTASCDRRNSTLEQSSSMRLHLTDDDTLQEGMENKLTEKVNEEHYSKALSIHEQETQEQGFVTINAYKQIVSTVEKSMPNDVGTDRIDKIKEETNPQTADRAPSLNQSGDKASENIYEAETQLIFKEPEIPKRNKESIDTFKDKDDSDIRESQICDFMDFTEDFEMPESQSLLLDVGSAPVEPPIAHTHLTMIKEEMNESTNEDEKTDNAIAIEPNLNSQPGKESNEPTTLQDKDANKSFDIHEAATQMPSVVNVVSLLNDSPPDIYNMATQCIVKDENSDDIFNAMTQCITKQEPNDDDSTDIEDDNPVSPTIKNANRDKYNDAAVEIMSRNDELVPKDECLTQIMDDESMTQTATADDDLTQADEDAMLIAMVENKIEIADDLNMTQVVEEPESANNQRDDPTNTGTLSKVHEEKDGDSNNKDEENIFLMSTQKLPENSNPINKRVFLSYENFSGETSIEPKHDDIGIGHKKVDNFTFSTPNVSEIRKKQKTLRNSDTSENNVSIVLKKIISPGNSSVSNNDDRYDCTQDVVDDLLSNTCSLNEVNHSSKKAEKRETSTKANFYQNTQEVFNDLCTQQQTNDRGDANISPGKENADCANLINKKSTISQRNQEAVTIKADDDFYKSTQDVYMDLVSQPPTVSDLVLFSKIPTPTKRSSALSNVKMASDGSQSSEYSEELFKSPRKRKFEFAVSDSELDSPQIDLFVLNAEANLEVSSNSDYDDNPKEETEEVPVVYRKAIPTKRVKIDKAKNDLGEKLDSAKRVPRKNAKKTMEETNKKEFKETRKRRASKDETPVSVTTKQKKTNSSDNDNDLNTNNLKKEPNKRKAKTVEVNKTNESSRNLTVNDENNSSIDAGKRRSTRARKVNRKFQDVVVCLTRLPEPDNNSPSTSKRNKSIEDKHTNKAKKNSSRMSNSSKEKCSLNESNVTVNRGSKNVEEKIKSNKKSSKDDSATKQRVSRNNGDSRNVKDLPKRGSSVSRKVGGDGLGQSSLNKWKNLKVMITSLDVTAFGKTVTSLGGAVVEKDGEVLVAPIPCKRTIKVMIAAAKGIPIVSQQWIAACQAAGHFVDPWKHILKCTALESKYNITLDRVLRTAQPYLKGWVVFITPSIPVPVDQLQELIETCGGTAEVVLKSVNRRSIKGSRGTKGTMTASCVEDSQLWPILPKPVVAIELILHGSFTHEVDIQSYLLKNK